MLGLAVLFALGLWLLMTIVAMVIGGKLAARWIKKPYASLVGILAGFMLTMGGFIVYWTVEYYQIQRTITRLCETEGGITVYVTPEEWRQQIGEEEWGKLRPYKTNAEEQSLNFLADRTINEIEYSFLFAINKRIVIFTSHYSVSKIRYTGRRDSIAIDIRTNQKIAKLTNFSSGVGNWMAGGGYKSWLNYIKSCSYLQSPFGKEFTETLLQYSNQQLN